MKQRVKLTLALLSDTDILLLDEPCSNLDEEGILWYKSMIANHSEGRIVVVASNQVAEEYFFCKVILNMNDLKS
jgi:ABC-type multidrug transport system ATPase subunit